MEESQLQGASNVENYLVEVEDNVEFADLSEETPKTDIKIELANLIVEEQIVRHDQLHDAPEERAVRTLRMDETHFRFSVNIHSRSTCPAARRSDG